MFEMFVVVPFLCIYSKVADTFHQTKNRFDKNKESAQIPRNRLIQEKKSI